MYKWQISLLKLNFGSTDLLHPFVVRLKDELSLGKLEYRDVQCKENSLDNFVGDNLGS